MMIYILTFHGSVNYGAALQSFALYKTVANLYGDCQLIDYNRINHHRNFTTGSLRAGNWKYRLRDFPRLLSRKALSRRFNHFILSSTKRTKPFNGKGSLFGADWHNEDIYITGSDQVFNTRITANDFHYYLDFTDSPNKVAYAPSFGTRDLDIAVKQQVAVLLNKYRFITVREESGGAIVRELKGDNPEVVLDPSFLISKEEWLRIAEKPKLKRKYVLIFRFNEKNTLFANALTYAHTLGFDAVNICYNTPSMKHAINLKNVSPLEWLGLFANAEKIYTDSFHGLAFSLIFEKPVEIALGEENECSRNIRFTDLLSRLDVDGCGISAQDYAVVRGKIKYLREYSLKKLRDMIDICLENSKNNGTGI